MSEENAKAALLDVLVALRLLEAKYMAICQSAPDTLKYIQHAIDVATKVGTPAVKPEEGQDYTVADEYPQLSREQMDDMNSGE